MQAVTKASHPLPEQFVETFPVPAIIEESLLGVAAQHHVICRSRVMESGFPSHNRTVAVGKRVTTYEAQFPLRARPEARSDASSSRSAAYRAVFRRA